MTIALRRFHLDGIGPPAARFDPLTVDLTDGDRPASSAVLFLENGGGKSVLLRLLFSVVLAGRRNTLGTVRFDGYIGSGDTGHVVLEWDTGDGVLVTGTVLEWRNRTKSSSSANLLQLWYSFGPQPGVLTIDELPIRDGDRRITRTGFRDRLQVLARERPSLGIVVEDSPQRWTEHLLRSTVLDPETFRYQRRMNADEADADSLFADMKADDDFVRFVVEAVHDPDELVEFGDLVDAHAAQLGRYDELVTEHRFCDAAAAALRYLAETAVAVDDAGTEIKAASTEVLTLRSRLTVAAAGADERAAAAARRAAEGEARAAELVSESNRAQALALEHRRLEATFLLVGAQAEEQAASDRLTAARRTLEAWRAAGSVVALGRADAELTGLRNAQEAVEHDLLPLRAAAESATARYAGRLVAEAAGLDLHADLAMLRAADALERVEEAAGAAASAQREEGEASGRAALRREQVAAVDTAIEEARADMLLGPVEPPADAAERAAVDERAARDALRAARERRSASTERLRRVDAELADLAGRIAGDESRLGAERAELGLNQRDASRLVSRLRVQEITPDADDLWLVGDAVIKALAATVAADESAHRRLDQEIDDLQVQLDALGVDGLLPPHPDLAVILDTLAAARIAATTGWRYLAQLEDPSLRTAVLDRNPALAGGVIVNDPALVGAARRALQDAGVETSTVVVLGPLEALDRETPDVVGAPVRPALYDPAWTASARAEMEARLADATDERDAAAARLANDAPLRGEVEALFQRCSNEHRARLVASVAAIDARLHAARVERGELRVERDDLATTVDGLEDKQQLLADELAACSSRRQRLAELAKHAMEAGRWRDEADGLDARVEASRRAAARASANAERHRAEAAAERDAAVQARADAGRRRADAAVLGVEPVADVPGPTTNALAGEFDAARQAYETERQGRDLTPEIQRIEQAVERVRQDLANVRADVRGEAEILAATPGAGDVVYRQGQLDSATALVSRLDAERTELLKAVGQAENVVTARTPPGRPRHVVLSPDEEPADAAAASAAAVAHQQRFQVLADEQRGVEASARADREGASRGENEATLLRAAIRVLPEVEGDTDHEAGDRPGEPWIEPADLAAEAAQLARNRYDVVARALADAERRRDDALGATRALANDRAYAGMGGVRVALAGEDATSLTARAGPLADELDAMRRSVEAELVDAERHREGIVVRLSTLAETHLRQLARMKTLSKLPDGLGDWSGKPFLAIEFEPASPAEIPARLGPVLDAAVADPRRRKPVDLLLAAMQAAVARRRGDREETFRVRLLRPNRAMTVEWAGVAELGSEFSGGMKLTAAICTYCTLAALRAGSRSSGRLFGLEPGPLFLDNPLGKASADYLLDLQHAVARRLGIQLVNTTGVWDVEALATYERVVRLRNLADLRRNVHRLRVDDSALSLVPGHQSGVDAVAFTVRRSAP